MSETEYTRNLVSSLGSTNVSLTGHGISVLRDGSIILTGSVEGKPPFPIHNEDDIADVRESSTHGLVVMLNSTGEILWARRTCQLLPKSHVLNAVDAADGIFVTCTNAPPFRNASRSAPGMTLMRYSKNGTRLFSTSHGTPRGSYFAVTAPSDSNANVTESRILLGCDVPAPVRRPNQETSDNGEIGNPRRTCIAVASSSDGSLIQKQILMDDDTKTVFSENPQDLALSAKKDIAYIACRRSVVVKHHYTVTERMYAINATNIGQVLAVRSVESRFGLKTRLTAPPSSLPDGVYVAEIVRNQNRERVVIYHLSKSLHFIDWPRRNTPEFEFVIEPDPTLIRFSETSIEDFAFDNYGNLQMLLVSSAVVDSTDQRNTESRLSNGRPVLMVISPAQKVLRIQQALTPNKWIPFSMKSENGTIFIVGTDHGHPRNSSHKRTNILLTAIKEKSFRMQAESTPTPQPTPIVLPACLGTSSMISGVPMKNVVRRNPDLRIQIHPLRFVSSLLRKEQDLVPMLCYSTEEPQRTKLCATAGHVVSWQGRRIYMEEFCRDHNITCSRQMEVPFNFKAKCGTNVAIDKELSATMHGAIHFNGESAQSVAESECIFQQRRRLLWVLQSL